MITKEQAALEVASLLEHVHGVETMDLNGRLQAAFIAGYNTAIDDSVVLLRGKENHDEADEVAKLR